MCIHRFKPPCGISEFLRQNLNILFLFTNHRRTGKRQPIPIPVFRHFGNQNIPRVFDGRQQFCHGRIENILVVDRGVAQIKRNAAILSIRHCFHLCRRGDQPACAQRFVDSCPQCPYRSGRVAVRQPLHRAASQHDKPHRNYQ